MELVADFLEILDVGGEIIMLAIFFDQADFAAETGCLMRQLE